MFTSLSDRLAATFKTLRGKGKLSESDVNKTVRDIRMALLEADVALPVVKDFTSAVRERALGAEVSEALNPAQQVIKIVNEELVDILGQHTRPLRLAKTAPTVIMLAGLQGSGKTTIAFGAITDRMVRFLVRSVIAKKNIVISGGTGSGKTTLAGKLAKWFKDQGDTPLLVAADLQRPNAVTQLEVVGQRAGVPVFAPEQGNVGGHDAVGATGEGTRSFGDPVEVAEDGIQHAISKLYNVVIVDTAGRLQIDDALMQELEQVRMVARPADIPSRGRDGRRLPGGHRLLRCRAHQARRRRPGWGRPVGCQDHRATDHVRLDR